MDAVAAGTRVLASGVTEFSFTVFGQPRQQGSMSARVLPTAPGEKPRAVVYHADDANLETWRRLVASRCGDLMLDEGHLRIEKPAAVELDVRWQFMWRKQDLDSHGAPKPSASPWKATAPDIDKLERALLDALTGVAYADDAQVARVVKERVYGRTFYTTVTVRQLP